MNEGKKVCAIRAQVLVLFINFISHISTAKGWSD